MTFPNEQNLAAGAIPVWMAPPPGQVLTPITTSTGTLIKTGAGTIYSINVNTPEAGATAAIYDGVDDTGTLLGTVSLAAVGQISLGWAFATGLFIQTAGGSPANITVSSV